jgi:hypothetical protein
MRWRRGEEEKRRRGEEEKRRREGREERSKSARYVKECMSLQVHSSLFHCETKFEAVRRTKSDVKSLQRGEKPTSGSKWDRPIDEDGGWAVGHSGAA